MTDKQEANSIRIEQAQALTVALQANDHAEVERLIDALASERDSALFLELGKLTRQFHDAMMSFSLDDRVVKLAEKDIPDAKERLNYVITMTEQAADTTLNAVEEVLPVSEAIAAQVGDLAVRWDRFLQRDMPFEEFKEFTKEISEHFSHSREGLALIQGKLNEVLMAQGFQDLTGQVIKRVIELVREVEENMVELVRISGKRYVPEAKLSEPAEEEEEHLQGTGPVVPGVDDRKGNTMASQDDVDDLLSSLGF
ncbi:protein phosphatase CheZ [Methylogaea oryzae]|uniref:Protein phosphatase CheZ n=1 Tax=Methylogaea oryzae TaxID=1295382 RepID=A0A8D4VP58_9GAMM|nr:protein phosphatase CheZ [Methylogaea oryzae]BBL71495.1 protein phosphatase CheZ [Methylogaea oryzae]